MNVFGKKAKQAPPPNIAQSIQQLREAQTVLEKRERHLDKQAQSFRAEARQRLQQKDKRGALFLLKKAKMYDAQISQNYGKRTNLDIQIMALEGAASNTAIFASMRAGQAALKVATASVDVDKVGDLMEDINESIQQQEEINEALSQQIGPIMDEDELNAELAEMEQEMADKELLEVGDLPSIKHVKTPTVAVTQPTVTTSTASTPPMPASRPTVTVGGTSSSTQPPVPQRKPLPIDDKEARELKELEAMMGM